MWLRCHREHPEGLARHIPSRLEHTLPVAGFEGPLPAARKQATAALEDDLRCPLRVRDDSVGRAVQGRHPLGLGRERDLGQPRETGVEIVLQKAGLRRRHDEGKLRGVSLGGPPGHCPRLVGTAFVSLEPGIGGECRGLEERHHRSRRRDGGAGFEEFPAGLVSGSGDVQRSPPGVDLPDGHLAPGEGAGLVGSDDRHASERLDGRQPPHQGVALRHTLRTEGQGDRDHSGKGLGHDGDGQRDPEDHHLPEGLAAHEAEKHDQRHDRQGRSGQHVAHPVEVLLQGRAAALDALQQPRDRPELRPHSGGHHDRRSAAVADGRAGIDHVVAVAYGQIHVVQRMGAFRGRLRLPGQRGFLDLQVCGRDDPRVRGHAGAGFQENDVAGDQRARRHVLLLPIAQCARHRCGHSAKALDGALGPVLLDEAQRHREQQDDGDDDGLQGVTQERGEADRDHEDQDQDVLELREKQAPRGGSAGSLELVRAVLDQAPGGIGGAQAAFGGGEPIQNGRDGERVPRGGGTGRRSRRRARRDRQPL